MEGFVEMLTVLFNTACGEVVAGKTILLHIPPPLKKTRPIPHHRPSPNLPLLTIAKILNLVPFKMAKFPVFVLFSHVEIVIWKIA